MQDYSYDMRRQDQQLNMTSSLDEMAEAQSHDGEDNNKEADTDRMTIRLRSK